MVKSKNVLTHIVASYYSLFETWFTYLESSFQTWFPSFSKVGGIFQLNFFCYRNWYKRNEIYKQKRCNVVLMLMSL